MKKDELIIKDECFNCHKEKDGFYEGDYDNPVFICLDCNGSVKADNTNTIFLDLDKVKEIVKEFEIKPTLSKSEYGYTNGLKLIINKRSEEYE